MTGWIERRETAARRPLGRLLAGRDQEEEPDICATQRGRALSGGRGHARPRGRLRRRAETRPHGQVFDAWLTSALEVRVKEGTLKASTATSYRSMVEEHLRPAFGHYRSDRLTLAEVEAWRQGLAEQIEAGTLAGKTYQTFGTCSTPSRTGPAIRPAPSRP